MDKKSKLGYSKNSPYKHLPEIEIKGNTITMAETDMDLYGYPKNKDGNIGKPVLMKAGRKEPYIFKNAVYVIEKPVKTMEKKKFKFQSGGTLNQGKKDKLFVLSKTNRNHTLDGWNIIKGKAPKQDATKSTAGYLQDLKDTKRVKQIGKNLYIKNKYQTGGASLGSNMVLLDHVGKPQMYMEGGELIYSIKTTKDIMEKANDAKTDEDFYELGQIVYKERMAQRKRDGE
jgi:hypothetical protein